MTPNIELRDFLASQAMMAVMLETQEVVPASPYDFLKQVLSNRLGMTFLVVRYKNIRGVYESAAIKAYQYADAMMSIREKSLNAPQ